MTERDSQHLESAQMNITKPSGSDKVFLNLEYFLNWMWSNEVFENDLLHTLYLGIGINMAN